MDGGRIGTLSFDLVTVSSKKIISNKLCKKVKKLSKLNQKRWGGRRLARQIEEAK